MRTILTPTGPAARVVDALGREWARKSNGTWACLGEAMTVDTFDQLDEQYVVTEVSR